MKVSRLMLSVVFGLAMSLHVVRGQASAGDALERALRDELKRSMEQLQLEKLGKPYFIAYRVTEMHTVGAIARFGSLASSYDQRERRLSVELRIGDYGFDNSNFFVMPSMSSRSSFGGSELPLDDDYAAFRRQIWLATDAAYKHAIETIAAKRSAQLNRRTNDSLPDFTREPVTRTTDIDESRFVSLGELQSLVRDLSGMHELAKLPTSSAGATLIEMRERFVSSEGTSYTRARPLMTVTLIVSAQANDGAGLNAQTSTFSAGYDPSAAHRELEARMRALAVGMDSLRAAPVIERYSGPVLFEGPAAAQLFADVFAPALLGSHPIQGATPGFSEMMNGPFGRGGAGSFADKIGARVLPEWMSVDDDPTMLRFENQLLLGHYKVDDEGVAAREKRVIEGGFLKTLLTTRAPVEGVEHSTGNARGSGAAPSTLIVRSDSGISDAALRQRLLAIVQRRKIPYGIIVREMQQGGGRAAMTQNMLEGDMESIMSQASGRSQGSSALLLAAYRVYPDGHEERIRGARLANFTVEAFRDVVAESATRSVVHSISGGMGMASMAMGNFGSGMPPVASYVVPSLLFEDVALAKPSGERTTPPLSGPPPAK